MHGVPCIAPASFIYTWNYVSRGNAGSLTGHTCITVFYIIGSSSHPVGHSFYPLPHPGQRVTLPGVPQPEMAQPGVTQPRFAQPRFAQLRFAQPRFAQPGVMQPGVMTQQQVAQQGAPQLHNVPQYMAAGFRMYRSKFYTILSKYSIFL